MRELSGDASRVPFTVIIPARFGSTRLAGKPLLDIAGIPMVVRVAQKARASGASHVYVATDDERIGAAARDHGYAVCMTRSDHVSGTDRLAEAVDQLQLGDKTIVVNLQGDEPLLEPSLVAAVAASLGAHPDAAIATACHRIEDPAEMFNPNVVKVVCDRQGYAMYFSRAPIPWARDAFTVDRTRIPVDLPVYRHYGLYGYRAGFLRRYSQLAPAPLEQFEALEQLRALWHGYRIIVEVVEGAPAPGVDTPADLQRVRSMFGVD